MNVSVFGLGYVGTVTAACLARDGFSVVGVDLSQQKVAKIARGESPVAEPGLAELLAGALHDGRLTATSDPCEAVRATEVSVLCVGTPTDQVTGNLDLSHVHQVIDQIAEALRGTNRRHVIVLRSTVPPGTTRACAARVRDALPGGDVHVAFNPEFLRESTAIADFDRPPQIVIGTDDPLAEQVVRQLYRCVNAPVRIMASVDAELLKMACNMWHAAKVTFANEIARVGHAVGGDGRAVMQALTADTVLNVSPRYMRPGGAYGGSCLPKDVSAMIHVARSKHVAAPMLEAVSSSNLAHQELTARRVLETRPKTVAILGLTFKPNTDDLRNSPAVDLVKHLIGEGCTVRIYDPQVFRGDLIGANEEFVRRAIPHFEKLLVPSASDALAGADVAVVMHDSPEVRDAIDEGPRPLRVVDSTGSFNPTLDGVELHGIAW